jgi:hypothetical protein
MIKARNGGDLPRLDGIGLSKRATLIPQQRESGMVIAPENKLATSVLKYSQGEWNWNRRVLHLQGDELRYFSDVPNGFVRNAFDLLKGRPKVGVRVEDLTVELADAEFRAKKSKPFCFRVVFPDSALIFYHLKGSQAAKKGVKKRSRELPKNRMKNILEKEGIEFEEDGNLDSLLLDKKKKDTQKSVKDGRAMIWTFAVDSQQMLDEWMTEIEKARNPDRADGEGEQANEEVKVDREGTLKFDEKLAAFNAQDSGNIFEKLEAKKNEERELRKREEDQLKREAEQEEEVRRNEEEARKSES